MFRFCSTWKKCLIKDHSFNKMFLLSIKDHSISILLDMFSKAANLGLEGKPRIVKINSKQPAPKTSLRPFPDFVCFLTEKFSYNNEIITTFLVFIQKFCDIVSVYRERSITARVPLKAT